MTLKLVNVAGSKNFYIRGTLCGVRVYETTKTSSVPHAEALLAKREAEVLDGHLISKGIHRQTPPIDKYGREMPPTHHLYRHYNPSGELLYVGMSISALKRLSQHKRNSRWYSELYLVKVEHFYSLESVLEAEKRAIKEEKPRYNIVHNKRRK